MLIVAYKYVTQSEYINETETKQKEQTNDAWYRMIKFCNLSPYKILVLVYIVCQTLIKWLLS